MNVKKQFDTTYNWENNWNCSEWKYLKYELQLPIYVAGEGRGWQTIIIKYEQQILNRRGIRGIQNTNFNAFTLWEKTNTVFGRLHRDVKTHYSIS